MSMWTVVGYFYDTGEVFVDWVGAEDCYQAMALTGKEYTDKNLIIIGALKDKQMLWTPGDDNGMTAAAEDMALLLEEDE